MSGNGELEELTNLQIFNIFSKGFVGKSVKNGKVGTIIGLDPAGTLNDLKP